MSNLFFVLGADDPEMQVIETLLRDCCLGTSYCYASADSISRCIAGNAYSAPIPLSAIRIAGEVEGAIIRLVECCDAPPGASYPRIDHHRPGDPGYGLPPSDFFRASSIGQVISLLATHGYWIGEPLSTATQPAGTLDYDGTGWAVSAVGALYVDGLSIPIDRPTWAHIPKQYIFVAAADHCLAAAYRGECPGVDPDELMEWRIETRAAHQGIDPLDLLKQVTATMGDLSRLSRAPIIDVTGEPGGSLPELPEAAVRLGVAYIASITDRDGRTKHVLGGHTTPQQVSEWMDSQRELGRDVYGDPARGFAGAYL